MQPATDRSLSSTAAELSVRWPDGGVGGSIGWCVLTAGLRTAAAVVGDPRAESLVAQRDSRTICIAGAARLLFFKAIQI